MRHSLVEIAVERKGVAYAPPDQIIEAGDRIQWRHGTHMKTALVTAVTLRPAGNKDGSLPLPPLWDPIFLDHPKYLEVLWTRESWVRI